MEKTFNNITQYKTKDVNAMHEVTKNIKPYSYKSNKFRKQIFVRKHRRRYYVKVGDKWELFNLSKKDENLEWLGNVAMEKEVRKAIRSYKKEKESLVRPTESGSMKHSSLKTIQVPPLKVDREEFVWQGMLRRKKLEELIKPIDDLNEKELKYNDMFKSLFPYGRGKGSTGRLSKSELTKKWKRKEINDTIYNYLLKEARNGNALPVDYFFLREGEFYLRHFFGDVSHLDAFKERKADLKSLRVLNENSLLDYKKEGFLQKVHTAKMELSRPEVINDEFMNSAKLLSYLEQVSLGYFGSDAKLTLRGKKRLTKAEDILQRVDEIKNYGKSKKTIDYITPERHFNLIYSQKERVGGYGDTMYGGAVYQNTRGTKAKDFNSWIINRFNKEIHGMKKDSVKYDSYDIVDVKHDLFGWGGSGRTSEKLIKHAYRVKGVGNELFITGIRNIPDFRKKRSEIYFYMSKDGDRSTRAIVREKDLTRYNYRKYDPEDVKQREKKFGMGWVGAVRPVTILKSEIEEPMHEL